MRTARSIHICSQMAWFAEHPDHVVGRKRKGLSHLFRHTTPTTTHPATTTPSRTRQVLLAQSQTTRTRRRTRDLLYGGDRRATRFAQSTARICCASTSSSRCTSLVVTTFMCRRHPNHLARARKRKRSCPLLAELRGGGKRRQCRLGRGTDQMDSHIIITTKHLPLTVLYSGEYYWVQNAVLLYNPHRFPERRKDTTLAVTPELFGQDIRATSCRPSRRRQRRSGRQAARTPTCPPPWG